MKAVVMAGGEGSRLRPITIGRPKPMVPIVGKPVMSYVIELLKRHGINDIVVTLQYLPGVIQDYFGDGAAYDVNLSYSVEDRPLGTAGSVKNAMAYLDETFLVISGDAITDFDLGQIVEAHKQRAAVATLALYHVPNPLEYGVIITDDSGRIRQFQEKPSWGEVFSDAINTGIYVLEPEAMDLVPADTMFDFSQDLFPQLLARRDSMYGYVAEGYWCDVGNIQEYMRAASDMLHGRVQIQLPGEQVQPGIWAAPGATWAPEAQIVGPVFLGDDARIRAGAHVIGPSTIGDYSIVDENAHVERSVIWSNSYIGPQVSISGALIGKQCNVHSGAVIFEGAVIGDNTVIGEGAIVQGDVKIWPNKEVETGASVNESLIWGARSRRSLFGAYGIAGLVNVDVTPEFAARVGAAYGAVTPKGAWITVNRDPHRSPRMIKRAMIAGLPSAGANVLDITTLPIPVARYVTRHSQAAGGIHVRISPFDDRVVEIKFFDAEGMDLDKAAERTIENTFFREDFRRVYLDEIGSIVVDEQPADRYTDAFLKAVDLEGITKANFSVVIDYAHGSSTQVFPSILNKLGCEVVAINSRVDESKMFRSAEQFQHELDQLGVITRSLNFDFGVRIDLGGEKIFVVDNGGRHIARRPWMTMFAAMASLFVKLHPGEPLAVPVTAPLVFEQLAAKHGSRVVYSRANDQAITATARTHNVGLAGDGDGGFIFPYFLPAYDSMLAIAKLMEFLAQSSARLSDVVDDLPSYHMSSLEVRCPWEYKGKVMRVLSEEYRGDGDNQVDGIKVPTDDGWVLVLPDADRPLFHVLAEAATDKHARGLVDDYSKRVLNLAK